MTRPARFSQADLTRAVVAMAKAGLCVTGAKIEPDGSILVLTAANDTAHLVPPNPLDRLHRHG